MPEYEINRITAVVSSEFMCLSSSLYADELKRSILVVQVLCIVHLETFT